MNWLQQRYAEGVLVNPITWDADGLLTVAVRHNRPDMLARLVGRRDRLFTGFPALALCRFGQT